MSKGNLFLGFGRGKVGDIVFSHTNGEQVTRARNRSPKNPQTPLQLLQRVVMKTVSTSYSLLQDITNHSFQGMQEGTENQSRYAVLNVAAFREKLAQYITSGDPEDILTCPETNYAAKSVSLAVVNPYIVSEGKLPVSDVQFTGGLFCLFFPVPLAAGTTAATITYQQVADALGLARGDQLTFLFLSVDDSSGPTADASLYNGFRYARVILEPNDGDMSSTFFLEGAINKPNTSNEGNVQLTFVAAAGDVAAHFTIATESMSTDSGKANSVAAATVIASRLAGGIWQRSTQALVVRPSDIAITGHLQFDTQLWLMGESIASFMTVQRSSLYLNQSENF